ncbi:MAG: proton-conducting transporter membrane subunit [Gammaproteobacteria bacterium]|jgi:formate hydrogenlyase subunit 3/multisubunit Na+/H+ antiporter MnhD subunit
MLLPMIWLVPLLLAIVTRPACARWLLPLAAVPALLAVAVLPVGTSLSLPWLLLGSELGIDATSRVFLGFSSLLWLIAALYIAGSPQPATESRRFRVFFLLAMAGNLGLIVAQDMISFYLGFVLMGLSAYGLIARASSVRAGYAARTYLVWTIAGELVLFTALVSLASGAGGALTFEALQTVPRSAPTVVLLIAGFGIKLALPLLHWWLPPVYAVTPVAAVALFSGVMIKAGLLGWLRFLPSGDATPAGWGVLLILIGAITIAFGFVAGLVQTRPRLLLGYSSISKMGILTTGLGAALAVPAAATGIVAALLVYATHHALAKTALLLGLGLVERGGLRLSLLIGLAFLAAVLAGAPLTSGALAKSALGDALPQTATTLVTLLSASTLATTLLMARLMFLVWTRRRQTHERLPGTPVAAWLSLVAVILALPLLLDGFDQSMSNTIPIAAGLLLGPLVVLTGNRVATRLSGAGKRARLRSWSSPLSTALRRARVKTRLISEWRNTAWDRSVAAARRASGEWLARVQQHGEPVRVRLTGALWLGIAGGLLGAFAAAT